MTTSRVSISVRAIITSAATHAEEPVMRCATLKAAMAGPAPLPGQAAQLRGLPCARLVKLLLPDARGEHGGVIAGERVHDVNGPARRSRAGLVFRVSRGCSVCRGDFGDGGPGGGVVDEVLAGAGGGDQGGGADVVDGSGLPRAAWWIWAIASSVNSSAVRPACSCACRGVS
jgi:hypothetical protein